MGNFKLNMKCKTLKLVEEYLVENIPDLGHAEQFLNMTLKNTSYKREKKKVGLCKNFLSVRDPIRRMKR